MYNIHTVNAIPVVKLQDKRTGAYTEHGRQCSTPHGEFRSVGVLTDYVIAHVPHECAGYEHLHPADARYALYQKLYQRCMKGSRGYKLL